MAALLLLRTSVPAGVAGQGALKTLQGSRSGPSSSTFPAKEEEWTTPRSCGSACWAPARRSSGGAPLDLGGPRQRAVLVVLLLARGEVVPVERLTEAVWGDRPPADPAGALQAYVSHLRRRLQPGSAARTRSAVIVSEGRGYAVRLPPDAVDVWRFERLLDRSGTATDASEAAQLVGEALALWRGPPLRGVGRRAVGRGGDRPASRAARGGPRTADGRPPRAGGGRAARARPGDDGRRGAAARGALAAAGARPLPGAPAGRRARRAAPGPGHPRRRAGGRSRAGAARARGAGAGPVARSRRPGPAGPGAGSGSRPRLRRRCESRTTCSTATARSLPCAPRSTTSPPASRGLLLIEGPAGIGKTRLLTEARRLAADAVGAGAHRPRQPAGEGVRVRRRPPAVRARARRRRAAGGAARRRGRAAPGRVFDLAPGGVARTVRSPSCTGCTGWR